MITRFAPGLSVLLLALPAAGEDGGSTLQFLDRLTAVPLPGEAAEGSGPDHEALAALVGLKVVRLVDLDPPAGFTPSAAAEVPLGITFDMGLPRRVATRLFETGDYRDVRVYARRAPEPGGVELLLAVEPMLRLRGLDVKGNQALSDDEVARAVEYAPDRTVIPEPEILRTLRQKLLDAYAARGFREAHATLRLETTREPGGVALIVEVEEGRPDRYVRVSMPGLPGGLVPAVVAGRAGLERGIPRDRAVVDKGVERILSHLADLGYLDAQAQQYEERRIGRNELELVIPIAAGLHTDVTFVGNVHFRTFDLYRELKGKTAFRTTPESFDRGLARVRDHYRRHAFFFVRLGAKRSCAAGDKGEAVLPIADRCPAGSTGQRIRVSIQEGPTVEVAHVAFEGNTFFSDRTLEQELFAFVKEKNEETGLFQPLTTETVDDMGISDKRPDDVERPSGAKAPRRRQERTYLPDLYRAAMEHLAGVYEEQGFLAAKVTDTCRIRERRDTTFRGRRYKPLVATRQAASAEEAKSGLEPCVFLGTGKDQLVVEVAVVEGPRTVISEISFLGNTVFPSRKLVDEAGLSIGASYNEYEIREATRRLTKLYRSHGHMFAEATWTKNVSENGERADIAFTVKEGPAVRAGRIRIEGAETTSRRLLGERLTFEEGDLLTPEKLEESQARLMDLGVLESATIEMVAPETAEPVKALLIQVREGKQQYLELRGGLATVEGVRGGFEYGFRNVGGWAVNARLRARANYRLFFLGNESFARRYREELSLVDQLEHHILLGLGSPHFPGTKGLLGWGLDAIKEQVNEPAFSADRITAFVRLSSTVAFGTAYRRGLVTELRTGMEVSEITLPSEVTALRENPKFALYARLPEGQSAFWVTGLNVSFDLRDHPFDTRRGIFLSVGADWVRSLDVFEQQDEFVQGAAGAEQIEHQSNLIRGQATVSGYIPLFGSDVVLAISFVGGYIFHLTSDSVTWADRYFYGGGVETLRGFPEESLVPEDIYQAWKDSLKHYSDKSDELLASRGGEVLIVTRAELRYPLAKGFLGALFGELGNVWRDREKVAIVEWSPFTLHMRPVAGGGIRYLTPLGPLSFDLGVNLNRRPHEDPFAWYFSIGSAF